MSARRLRNFPGKCLGRWGKRTIEEKREEGRRRAAGKTPAGEKRVLGGEYRQRPAARVPTWNPMLKKTVPVKRLALKAHMANSSTTFQSA